MRDIKWAKSQLTLRKRDERTDFTIGYNGGLDSGLGVLEVIDDAEPHLYNIAGHMMDYYQAGTLSEKHLIELIDKELTAFYNKGRKTYER